MGLGSTQTRSELSSRRVFHWWRFFPNKKSHKTQSGRGLQSNYQHLCGTASPAKPGVYWVSTSKAPIKPWAAQGGWFSAPSPSQGEGWDGG